jgi:sulfite reductase alpha subunit-like flavoprotein
LRHSIDIRSEKIKFSKFNKDDTRVMSLLEYIEFDKSGFKIPVSSIEDELPRIKPREYSIINDPYY